ncbi:hypothetical protein JHK87_042945 [Glycine soja]|nr:hypothetical protein JHK87_042945 [Glycine soja]
MFKFHDDLTAFPQDLQDQEETRQEDEAEQAHPLLDPHENRQYHQVPETLIINCTMLSAGTGAAPSLDFKVDANLRLEIFVLVLVF